MWIHEIHTRALEDPPGRVFSHFPTRFPHRMPDRDVVIQSSLLPCGLDESENPAAQDICAHGTAGRRRSCPGRGTKDCGGSSQCILAEHEFLLRAPLKTLRRS